MTRSILMEVRSAIASYYGSATPDAQNSVGRCARRD